MNILPELLEGRRLSATSASATVAAITAVGQDSLFRVASVGATRRARSSIVIKIA
jgi:hypothetical protein